MCMIRILKQLTYVIHERSQDAQSVTLPVAALQKPVVLGKSLSFLFLMMCVGTCKLMDVFIASMQKKLAGIPVRSWRGVIVVIDRVPKAAIFLCHLLIMPIIYV